MEYVSFGVGIPDKGCIVQLWAYKCVIRSLSDFTVFCFNVSLDKSKSVVDFSSYVFCVAIPGYATGYVNPKYLALVTASRTWPCKLYGKCTDFLEVILTP